MENKGIFDAIGAPQSKDFSPAPGQITTRFGNLDFAGGYPTDDTVQKVYDELDLQRATQLYLDMYPALSMHGMLTGVVRDYGVSQLLRYRCDGGPAGLQGALPDRQHREHLRLRRGRHEG